MPRQTKVITESDALERFLEMFPSGYFKNTRSIAKPLAMFSEALESGRVITIDVRRRGWLMKSARNPRANLARWIKRRGLDKSEVERPKIASNTKARRKSKRKAGKK